MIATALLRDHSKRVDGTDDVALAVATAAGYGRPSLARRSRNTGPALRPDDAGRHHQRRTGDRWQLLDRMAGRVPREPDDVSSESGERRPIYGLTFRSSETNGLWAAEPDVVLAAAPGDIELERFAERAGLVTTFTERRGVIDLFQVRSGGTRRIRNCEVGIGARPTSNVND